jgi:hypothetical protein
MTNLEEIAARKQELLGRSDSQRFEIARTYYQWHARTNTARQVTRVLKNPFFLAGVALVALKMPGRRAYRFGGWAWKGWRLVRTIRRMFI